MEIAQCINNITLLLPILRQEAKKVLLNPNIGSSISVQQIRRYLYMSPRRNLKTTQDGTRKAVELSKAVISSKIPNTRLQKLSSKPFMHQ
jgi:hypothetical protein